MLSLKEAVSNANTACLDSSLVITDSRAATWLRDPPRVYIDQPAPVSTEQPSPQKDTTNSLRLMLQLGRRVRRSCLNSS
ncbi:hypothetical protein LIER_13168 [Lithospermum erythrorhizon]|uniref:Uncharacterized protein n=1 Tax=Lithospermum erythrorhizon TaxID=34254 RepID=A0AAV3PWG8_LITER